MPKKHKKSNRLLAEFIFWLHFLISVAILLMGLFLAWYWVVMVLLLLRLHQVLLHGCVVTLLAQKEGAMPKGVVFYQLMAQRFFGYRLKRKYVAPIMIVHYGGAILLSVLAGQYNFRIHL